MGRVTEADLEAKLSEKLKNFFPWIGDNGIKLQTTFNLKLGHKEKIISNDADSLRGRSDIIVYLGDEPLFVCELKAPDIELTEDDKKQGVSYARLHSPMVPMVVLTNSNEIKFYNAFDERELFFEEYGLKHIKQKIETISKECTKSLEDVLRALSGGKSEDVSAFFAELNKKTLQSIQKSNIINRKIVNELIDFENSKIYTIVCGKAFSGKTMVAYLTSLDLSQKKITNVYVDLKASSGIFNQIERVLYDVFVTTLNNTNVKEWLRSFCSQNKIAILVDDVDEESFKSNEREIKEILEIFSNNQGRLILFVNEINDCYLFNTNGRLSQNIYTDITQTKQLHHIDSQEFFPWAKEKKLSLFYCLFPICKYPFFFNFLQKALKTSPSPLENYVDLLIESLDILYNQETLSTETEDFFEDLFTFYFEDYLNEKNDSDEYAIAKLKEREIPCILRPSLRKKFPDEKIKQAINQGYLSREKNESLDFVTFKVPFVLLKPIYNFFLRKINQSPNEGIEFLLNQSERIVDGDIFATYVLYKCIKKQYANAHTILCNLFKNKPQSYLMTKGVIAELDNNQLIQHEINAETYPNGIMLYENELPWMILSFLESISSINEKIDTSVLQSHLMAMTTYERRMSRFKGMQIACEEYDEKRDCPNCLRKEFPEPILFALTTTKQLKSGCIAAMKQEPTINEIARYRLNQMEMFMIMSEINT